VILSVLYILFGRLSLVFATKGSFTPFLAAWVPNIIFGTLSYYFYTALRSKVRSRITFRNHFQPFSSLL
jgi:lipopolysaccharide export LptBFGC system permease protein LptF